MRDFVRSFHEAAVAALSDRKERIDLVIAQKVMNQHREARNLELDLKHREALRTVLEHGFLTGRQREVEEALLRSTYLLVYSDESSGSWFDAHPEVLPLL